MARAQLVYAGAHARRPVNPAANIKKRVVEVLASLERRGSRRVRDAMGPRYGIFTDNAYGVPIREIQAIARQIGRDHELAEALWETGVYEARLLTAYVDDPAAVTAAQMERWAKAFDNWGVVDTVCFSLFDRSPHAWRKVAPWCERREEFVRRAGFVLLACLALHDKGTGDDAFMKTLPLLERGATDERHLVSKAVSWAIRSIGGRSAALNAALVELGERLAAADNAPSRTVGRLALKDLRAPALQKRLGAKTPTAKSTRLRR
jgi:3-methyladenine DNA glycosylase AlkD